MVIIYTLSCPFTNEVKYVGKTIKPLSDRLTEHIGDARRNVNKRCNWIKSLLRQNSAPIIESIDEVTENSGLVETYWIHQLRAWGFNLKNMTDGGEGAPGRIISEETRRKMSDSQKGRKPSQSQIRKGVNTRMMNGSYKKTAEALIKQSISLTGKKRTPEQKLKISIANTGKKRSVEHRKKQSDSRKGKRPPHTILKPVSCYSLSGYLIQDYESISHAARSTGIGITSITNCLSNRSKKAGGFVWKYQIFVAPMNRPFV